MKETLRVCTTKTRSGSNNQGARGVPAGYLSVEKV